MCKWTPYADLIIRNANVYTLDISIDDIKHKKYDFAIYSDGFVAAKDGKTIAVGEGNGAEFEGPDTRIIDAEGRTVMPGLIDCHMHDMEYGMEAQGINFSNTGSVQEFVEKLQAAARNAKTGQWIKGSNWNEAAWTEMRPPTCKDIDPVTGKNPVYCQHISHHVCVTNSLGMQLAGITRDTPDPEGGKIGRFENGEPNGVFYERAAISLIEQAMPEITEEEHFCALENAAKEMNRFGITQCMNSMMTFDEMRTYLQAEKRGRLHYRANLMFSLDRALGDMDYQLERIRQMIAVTGFGNSMVRIAGLKIILDGIMLAGTAALRESYVHLPDHYGETTYTREELLKLGTLAGKYHWQIGIHCCGDRSADLAMDTFESTGHPEDRHFIVHMSIAHEDQMERLKALDASLSMQPLINSLLKEQEVIGEKYSSIYMPLKTPFEKGIIVGGSSDMPVVSCNPFLGIYSAVTRKLSDGTVHRPEEKIDVVQALCMWTRNAAYLCNTEEYAGKIAVGAYADYVIVDQPVLSIPEEELQSVTVWKTILGGQEVYSASCE